MAWASSILEHSDGLTTAPDLLARSCALSVALLWVAPGNTPPLHRVSSQAGSSPTFAPFAQGVDPGPELAALGVDPTAQGVDPGPELAALCVDPPTELKDGGDQSTEGRSEERDRRPRHRHHDVRSTVSPGYDTRVAE